MKCAFYEKDITPPLYGHLLGCGTVRVAQDVEDKLYAKAVVFEDGGKYCAILTLDSICVYADFCEKIRDRVCEYTDIPREAIAVVANHTHYGIPMGDTVSERDVEYMAVLERLAADTVILAYKRLEDCTLYVTMEPCPMCAGAMVNSRIGRVVFGCYDAVAGCCGSVLNFNCYPFNHSFAIEGGVRAEECKKLLTDFFEKKRK